MVGPAPLVLAALSVEEADACGDDASSACLAVYRWTESDLLARTADWFVARPLKIALIVALALVVIHLVRKGINRFVESLSRGDVRGEPSRGDAISLAVAAPLGVRARQRAETIAQVLRGMAGATIWLLAGLTVLGELGINLGPLIAGAGIAGVALGFGAQTLVRDFLAGTFMLIEDQFGVGDIVDVGPASGVVEGVSLRVTRLRDVEGVVWHVPNGEIRRVGNQSQDWSRAVLDVQVVHGTDLGLASEVLRTVASEMREDEEWSSVILEEPEVWGVQEVGSMGITLRLVLKTRPADQWSVQRSLRRRISDAFAAAGIEVPVFQQIARPPDT